MVGDHYSYLFYHHYRSVFTKVKTMKVSAIKCRHCGDTVFSRADHDMRFCSCKRVSIDGGRSYFKASGIESDIVVVDVDQTHKDLYDDWNNRTDRFGIIKKGSHKTNPELDNLILDIVKN